jgi:hypothetical protein
VSRFNSLKRRLYLPPVGGCGQGSINAHHLARSLQLLLLLSAHCPRSPCSFSSLPPFLLGHKCHCRCRCLDRVHSPPASQGPNGHSPALRAPTATGTTTDSWSTGGQVHAAGRMAPLLRLLAAAATPLQYSSCSYSSTVRSGLCRGLVTPINARRVLPAELAGRGGGWRRRPSWPCPCHACVRERAGWLVGR